MRPWRARCIMNFLWPKLGRWLPIIGQWWSPSSQVIGRLQQRRRNTSSESTAIYFSFWPFVRFVLCYDYFREKVQLASTQSYMRAYNMSGLQDYNLVQQLATIAGKTSPLRRLPVIASTSTVPLTNHYLKKQRGIYTDQENIPLGTKIQSKVKGKTKVTF